MLQVESAIGFLAGVNVFGCRIAECTLKKWLVIEECCLSGVVQDWWRSFTGNCSWGINPSPAILSVPVSLPMRVRSPAISSHKVQRGVLANFIN